MKKTLSPHKYHKKIVIYLLTLGKCKTKGYDVAKWDNNIANDSLYSKAMDDLMKWGWVIKDDEGYKINDHELGFITDECWLPLFKAHEKLLENLFDSRKLTFLDWMKEMRCFGNDMIRCSLKEILQQPKSRRQKILAQMLKQYNKIS